MIASNSPALAETLQSGQEDIFARNLTVVEPADVTKPSQNIPVELKALPQWVAWKAVPRLDGSKPTKVPVDVKSEREAQANNPNTWSSFDDVQEFLEEWAGEEHTLKKAIHDTTARYQSRERFDGEGPERFRLGRKIVYPVKPFIEWLIARSLPVEKRVR